jgi:uracil-DNA glycosylase family 4
MSEISQDEARAELAALVDEARLHLSWLQDAGVRFVRREAVNSDSPAVKTSPPAAARERPSFLAEPARPSPVTPPRPVAPVAPAPVPRAPATQAPTEPPIAPVPVPRPPAVTAPHVAAQALGSAVHALKVIRDDIGDCRRCGLCTTRNTIVYGQGSAQAELMFVGEGPGEDEDKSGLAFVGRAGQLLTKMIEAMGYTRDEVYIANIVKCRPPGNRRPEPAEIAACRPFVERQLRAVKPKVVVALGATATQALLRTTDSITSLRNQWTAWEGIPVMPTFHPSYLLRAPEEKAKAWADLQLVMARLGKQRPSK